MMTNIAVTTNISDLKQNAELLAKRLHLPCDFAPADKYDFLLTLTPDYLGLIKVGSKSKPLYIDFLSEKMQYRCKHASLRKEIIARALGLKNKSPRTIVDATAGLGRDSFILATLGFEVQLLERSPIVHCLLEDALLRAAKDPRTASIVKRLHLIQTDAISWIKNNPQDIVYLDPMFPERKKSALSKQDMRIFHEIVGNDDDGERLLKIALTCANQRVVVKRPRLAEPLARLKPTFSMEGSSNRFDIYLIQDKHGYTSSVT